MVPNVVASLFDRYNGGLGDDVRPHHDPPPVIGMPNDCCDIVETPLSSCITMMIDVVVVVVVNDDALYTTTSSTTSTVEYYKY